jgi:PAS domain S-box-containing protein
MADIQLDTEEKFRALIEHSTDIVSVLDEDGTILYQSPSVQRVLGYEQGTIRGDSAFEYVHPDDREAVVEAFTRLVQGERSKTERVEFRFRDAEGSWVWLEAVGSNQTHTALDGYVITSRDITERKERERALERKNERLDEFASIVSHDLRNPLRVVEGSIELYHETGDENHYERSLDGIERMRRLIDDLLVLARYGDSVVDPEPVDLSDVAADAWGMVASSRAELTVHDELTLEADPGQLCRLLENLFENAIEHGGPAVSVTVGTTPSGFYIADDGPGISDEKQDDVFEAGYSTAENGTGYGLRIVERVAEAHGWDVSVTDSAEGGARFEVTGVESA